jgi:DNA-binding response OmpR family regulator
MGARTILLIEDDLNVYHGIRRRLSASNYETHYAPDAVASIAQARLHHPDLILLDLGLPAGDGFVVMDRLKLIPELSNIPIIVLSGRDRAANETRSLRSGAAAFLQKPVSGDLLLKTIDRLLSKQTRSADAAGYSVSAEPESVQTFTLSR